MFEVLAVFTSSDAISGIIRTFSGCSLVRVGIRVWARVSKCLLDQLDIHHNYIKVKLTTNPTGVLFHPFFFGFI